MGRIGLIIMAFTHTNQQIPDKHKTNSEKLNNLMSNIEDTFKKIDENAPEDAPHDVNSYSLMEATKGNPMPPRLQLNCAMQNECGGNTDLHIQTLINTLVEETEVKVLTKTVAEVENRLENLRERRHDREKHLLQRKMVNDVHKKFIHYSFNTARNASKQLETIKRELNEGEKRLVQVNETLEYNRKFKVKLKTQEEELAYLKEQLDVKMRSIAELKKQIGSKTEKHKALKEKEKKANGNLKTTEEKYKAKRQAELDQHNSAFSTLWKTTNECCILYTNLLDLTEKEIQLDTNKLMDSEPSTDLGTDTNESSNENQVCEDIITEELPTVLSPTITLNLDSDSSSPSVHLKLSPTNTLSPSEEHDCSPNIEINP